MKSISKNIFLNTLACATLGWMTRTGEAEKLTPGQQFLVEQGNEIHRLARELFPAGVLVEQTALRPAATQTNEAMNNPRTGAVLEGAFIVDQYSARADALVRTDEGWRLIEVKGSLNDKPDFINDMAYTAMVVRQSGWPITQANLVLISREFRLGMGKRDLFVELDHTREVLERSREFETSWDYVKDVTSLPVKPEPQPRFECKKCPALWNCIAKGIENPIFDLPRLSKKKCDALQKSGVLRIEDISNDFPLTENQARVRDVVRAGKLLVYGNLKRELARISWPAYYLDFETFATAFPLYLGVAPYEQLPTQFSIHLCSDPGHVTDHISYFTDPTHDSRGELAERLIHDLKGNTSIIVYSTFEKQVINRLAALYPHMASDLQTLADRLVNLEAILRKNVYHPAFHGSTSLKMTQPALVLELSYEALKIASGSDAMAAFAYLAMGRYEDPNEADSVKNDLVEYCSQDTLAMVRLHQRLVDLALA